MPVLNLCCFFTPFGLLSIVHAGCVDIFLLSLSHMPNLTYQWLSSAVMSTLRIEHPSEESQTNLTDC